MVPRHLADLYVCEFVCSYDTIWQTLSFQVLFNGQLCLEADHYVLFQMNVKYLISHFWGSNNEILPKDMQADAWRFSSVNFLRHRWALNTYQNTWHILVRLKLDPTFFSTRTKFLTQN